MLGADLPQVSFAPVDVAAALAAAYAETHGGAAPPSPETVVYPLAQILGAEGSLSDYFGGTNNLGAIHATSGFEKAHTGEAGYGAVAFLDHSPGGGAYITRMRVYPTLVEGARGFLSLVSGALAHVASETDYATALYARGYFEGLSAPATPIAQRGAAWGQNAWTDADRANIASYANAITRTEAPARAAYAQLATYSGDPRSFVSGPPFASLEDRLTPADAYAPHTLEHARALLGANADNPPPGAISLQDCLSAPAGDGVWMFSAGGMPSAQPGTVAHVPRPAWGALGALVAGAAALGAGLYFAWQRPAWLVEVMT